MGHGGLGGDRQRQKSVSQELVGQIRGWESAALFAGVGMDEAERVAARLAYSYDRGSWLCGRVYGYLAVRRGIDFVAAGQNSMHGILQALGVLDGCVGWGSESFLGCLLARGAQICEGVREAGGDVIDWRVRLGGILAFFVHGDLIRLRLFYRDRLRAWRRLTDSGFGGYMAARRRPPARVTGMWLNGWRFIRRLARAGAAAH